MCSGPFTGLAAQATSRQAPARRFRPLRHRGHTVRAPLSNLASPYAHCNRRTVRRVLRVSWTARFGRTPAAPPERDDCRPLPLRRKKRKDFSSLRTRPVPETFIRPQPHAGFSRLRGARADIVDTEAPSADTVVAACVSLSGLEKSQRRLPPAFARAAGSGCGAVFRDCATRPGFRPRRANHSVPVRPRVKGVPTLTAKSSPANERASGCGSCQLCVSGVAVRVKRCRGPSTMRPPCSADFPPFTPPASRHHRACHARTVPWHDLADPSSPMSLPVPSHLGQPIARPCPSRNRQAASPGIGGPRIGVCLSNGLFHVKRDSCTSNGIRRMRGSDPLVPDALFDRPARQRGAIGSNERAPPAQVGMASLRNPSDEIDPGMDRFESVSRRLDREPEYEVAAISALISSSLLLALRLRRNAPRRE